MSLYMSHGRSEYLLFLNVDKCMVFIKQPNWSCFIYYLVHALEAEIRMLMGL